MSTKVALKAAKAAIDGHQYEQAAKEAQKALDFDSQNYHANIFLGLALEKQDKNDESEKAYSHAATIKAKDPLVWQGLITLYEKQAGKKIDEYQQAALHLAEYYMEADDRTRCQIIVDRFVGYAKQHGSRTQYKHALGMMLPTCSIYSYLEGRIPNPAHTYTKVAEIVEAEERERINKEIGERRTRLGAKIGQVTTEVKREVFESSELERLYSCIIDWTPDDDQRRMYEEKMLQRAYDTLAVLAPQQKDEKRSQVLKLAKGLVILKHPYALAWTVVLEWKDVENFDDWDAGLLIEYVKFFPEDGLSKVLKGFLDSEISPFPKVVKTLDKESDDENDKIPMSADDRLLLMSEGAEESSRSVMSQRLVGDYFLYLEEYSSAAEYARKANELIHLETTLSGLRFENNFDAVNITLATALIHHQSPRNHPEARAICDDILQRRPHNTAALIGVGLILEEEEDFEGAMNFLDRALMRTVDVKVKAEAAWCRALNGDYDAGLQQLEDCLPDLKGDDIRTKDLKSQTLYRIGICMWNIDSSKMARKDRTGAYSRFLSSLQANLNYAPAYTALGIYYGDYAKDKKRSRKCFQKAFELSASEVVAAERLARAFADSKEWDLVEAVAKRVVDSGKVRPPPGSKRKGLSWPFAALGVCQLNGLDYARSVVSFQSALRISPEDFHCWVGLGESYHNSGRYIAATKAFEQAQKLETAADDVHTENSWFSRYMLANVRRELGDFEQATRGYGDVLSSQPKEFGVVIALLQTHVESAWRNVELGFFGRAANSALSALAVAKALMNERPDAFNAWKAIGDACSIFSWVQDHATVFPSMDLYMILQSGVDQAVYDELLELDNIGQSTLRLLSTSEPSSTGLAAYLYASILSHKRALHECSYDVHAQAVAWYNLGWAEYRAHVCLTNDPGNGSRRGKNRFLKASLQCLKRAIELEAGNSEFWNSLGVVTTQMNPKVAQHAFVRSLHLNDKSARVWTNLGALYLIQNDNQLANDAFTRAQSADPDYSHAWLGQGILALLLGETKEAQSLFTHAFEIADSSSISAKKLYSSSSFDHLLTSHASNTQITDVLQPLFALHQLKSQITADVAFEHLSGLLSERIGAHTESIEALTSVCDTVEAEYERSESPLALAHYAQAKADLARAQLAVNKYALAAETAETALDLTTDDDSGRPDPAARRKYRLSAHLTAGLAYYYTEAMDQAIVMFRTALEETDGNPDTVCVLAQILWAKGGKEERDVAREQLFDCVEKHPGHSEAILLLGAIAMLDDDNETIEAVIGDLQSLRNRTDLDNHQQRKIGQLLAALATSGTDQESRDSAELSEATAAVMLAPSQPYGWNQLAELTEDQYPADMALLAAAGAVPPKGSINADGLCRAHAGTGRLSDAQRGIMVAPWMVDGWQALAPNGVMCMVE